MVLFLMGSLVASAQSRSAAEPVTFVDEADLFAGQNLNGEWFPSPDAPLAIRFYAAPVGTLRTRLEGESTLRWGSPGPGEDVIVEHQVRGRTGGVEVDLDAGLEVSADVQINLLGILVDVVSLADTTVRFAPQSTTASGMLLPDFPALQFSDTATLTTLTWGQELSDGYFLEVDVDLAPILTVDLVGERILTESDGIPYSHLVEGEWVDIPLPDPVFRLPLNTQWEGRMTTTVDLNLVPRVRLQTPFGNFSLGGAGGLPVPLQEVQEVRLTAPILVEHALPSVSADFDRHDFGEVLVGEERTLQVPLDNFGSAGFLGAAQVDGPSSFEVFPKGLAAPPKGGSDGLVITFAPVEPGEQEAVVVLETNDPWNPELRIDVQGVGVEVEEERSSINSESLRGGCGCATPGSSGAAWLVLGAGLLVARRRRAGATPEGQSSS